MKPALKQGQISKLEAGIAQNYALALKSSALASELDQIRAAVKEQKAMARKQTTGTGLRCQASSEPSSGSNLQSGFDPATILLVEDDPADAALVKKVLHKVGVTNPLAVVRDGQQAIRYLKGEGRYSDRSLSPIPKLILLDLYMPEVDGFEVLTWLRQEPELRHLPVVILTGSTYSPDVKRAYQLGANSFLTKPTDFTDLVSEVKQMAEFWLGRRARANSHARRLSASA